MLKARMEKCGFEEQDAFCWKYLRDDRPLTRIANPSYADFFVFAENLGLLDDEEIELYEKVRTVGNASSHDSEYKVSKKDTEAARKAIEEIYENSLAASPNANPDSEKPVLEFDEEAIAATRKDFLTKALEASMMTAEIEQKLVRNEKRLNQANGKREQEKYEKWINEDKQSLKNMPGYAKAFYERLAREWPEDAKKITGSATLSSIEGALGGLENKANYISRQMGRISSKESFIDRQRLNWSRANEVEEARKALEGMQEDLADAQEEFRGMATSLAAQIENAKSVLDAETIDDLTKRADAITNDAGLSQNPFDRETEVPGASWQPDSKIAEKGAGFLASLGKFPLFKLAVIIVVLWILLRIVFAAVSRPLFGI